MSDTLPSWLVGGLDNDKSVGQAARSGLARVFEGEQKQHALWLKYALPLITYSQDVLFEQSALTLSDERTTTPDDATSKYSRAAGGGMQLLGSLISRYMTANARLRPSLTDHQISYRLLSYKITHLH